MQITAPDILSAYIRHYLILNCDYSCERRLRLFSDASMGMVFCLDQSSISMDRTPLLSPSFVYGQISQFKDLYLAHRTSFIVVVFQPDGLFKLLGIPAYSLKDQIIDAQDLFGQAGRKLTVQLINTNSVKEQLNILNSFFYTRSSNSQASDQHIISSATELISKHQQPVTVEKLVRHTGYSERHIERVFHEHIGLSPKKFAGIIQLHRFLKLLKNSADRHNMTGLAYEAGYFDQSHLIRSFRKNIGLTPSKYLKSNRLAINFMEFASPSATMSDLYNFP